MLQSIGPLVERGAVAAVGEGAEIRTFGAGAGIVEVGVAGRVGNDVGHRDAEIVMYGVGHGVAVHVLAAGGMAGNDDGLEVGEDVFLCQLAQDLVGEIERRQLFIIGGRAAGAPTVSGATPAHLVGRQLVAATSGAGGEVRCDDDGVVERAAQERGGEGGAEVVIGVAGGAVDDDECARDLGIRAVERVGAVDEGAGGSAGESHPFGTVGHDGAWRRPSGGGQETKGKQLHWRLGYNVSHGGSPLAAFLSCPTNPRHTAFSRFWGICLVGRSPWTAADALVRLLAGQPGGRPRARAPAPHRSTERGLPESSRYPTSRFESEFVKRRTKSRMELQAYLLSVLPDSPRAGDRLRSEER